MILAIVQSRMNSKRFPGKVMRPILGKPLIGYILERLSQSKKIDKIILATSINKENDTLCDYTISSGHGVFRGSEEDVLERYHVAAKKYEAKTIVRITGDCPLIDPEICDKLIQFYFDEKADYAILSPNFAEGLDCEVFSTKLLEKAYLSALSKSEREHVTLFYRNNPDIFNIKTLSNDQDDSQYRVTVDNHEDFDVVESIIRHFMPDPNISWAETKNFLKKRPDIVAKNSNIERNEGLRISIEQDKKHESGRGI
jgi:spore coat polysaccharide biosynthesis protein SpsF